MHDTGLVSVWAQCTRWTLNCGLLLAVVSNRIWWSQPTYSPMRRWFSIHLTLLYQPLLLRSLSSLKQWLPFIVFHSETPPFNHPSRKSVLPPQQSSSCLSPAPSTFLPPFHPFWNHISSLPLKRIAASLFLPSSPSFPLMRIHNLSPVAWTPIPQCGCLIGFGCGCTSGTRLQVVSSWPRAAWAVLDPEGWEWAE